MNARLETSPSSHEPNAPIDRPVLYASREVAPDTYVFPAFFPLPGAILPMQSYLIGGDHPVLLDTGPPSLAGDFIRELERHIDLGELETIWLTHADPDHTGALDEVLRRAPRAKVHTGFLALAKLQLSRVVDPTRFVIVEPGQQLRFGDQSLRALRPPSYDAPETIGLFDERRGTWFSSDCFGALLSKPTFDLDDLAHEELRSRMLAWADFDTPWLRMVQRRAFRKIGEEFLSLAPTTVLSSHLPPAPGRAQELLEVLTSATVES